MNAGSSGLSWKPRYSSDTIKERRGAREGRKDISRLYDAMCHYCGKHLPDVESKEEHAAAHYTILKTIGWRCNTCYQIFTPMKELYRHMQKVHTGYAFRCLVSTCAHVSNDKKCIIDHHYGCHSAEEYTKVPRIYKCETDYVRRYYGDDDPEGEEEPDPTGEVSRMYQPQVVMERMTQDEVDYYTYDDDDDEDGEEEESNLLSTSESDDTTDWESECENISPINVNVKVLDRTSMAHSRCDVNLLRHKPDLNMLGSGITSKTLDQNENRVTLVSNSVFNCFSRKNSQDSEVVKVLMTKDFVNSLPRLNKPLPGLSTLDPEDLKHVPVRGTTIVNSIDSLNKCLFEF